MAEFRYTGRTAEGKTVKGKLIANDEAELQNRLHEQNIYLISAKQHDTTKRAKQFKPQVLSDFARQMGTLLAAGVTLVRALNIIANGEAVKPKEKVVYQELLRQLRQGTALSDAMENLNGVFPSLMIYMYRSAESSGNIDKVSLQLATHYEKSYKLQSKVSSSLTYPKLLVVMIIGVVIIMVKLILPKFADLFAAMDQLPLATRILMGLSGFVENHWKLLIIIIAAAAVLIRSSLMIPAVRMVWDRVKIKAPMFGKLNMTVYTSRFARTLSSLYSAGIPIVSSLQIARKTIGNEYIDRQFDKVIPFVRAGNNLSDGVDSVDGFVRKLTDNIRVGEETGSLDSMLASSADIMEYDADLAIGKMVTIIEPMMLIVMGGIVAFVLLAVFSALMGSYGSLAGMAG